MSCCGAVCIGIRTHPLMTIIMAGCQTDCEPAALIGGASAGNKNAQRGLRAQRSGFYYEGRVGLILKSRTSYRAVPFTPIVLNRRARGTTQCELREFNFVVAPRQLLPLEKFSPAPRERFIPRAEVFGIIPILSE